MNYQHTYKLLQVIIPTNRNQNSHNSALANSVSAKKYKLELIQIIIFNSKLIELIQVQIAYPYLVTNQIETKSPLYNILQFRPAKRKIKVPWVISIKQKKSSYNIYVNIYQASTILT